jgi:hypothetical protein
MYTGGAECSCDVLERLGMELRLLEGCCACCFWCGQPRHDLAASPQVKSAVVCTSLSCAKDVPTNSARCKVHCPAVRRLDQR